MIDSPLISLLAWSTFHVQDARDIYRPRLRVFWPEGGKKEPGYGVIPSNSGKTIQKHDRFDALIVGDSFAEPLAGVMAALAKDLKTDYILLSHAGCLPLFDDSSLNPRIKDYLNPAENKRADLCKRVLRPNMMKRIRSANTDVVIIAGNWSGNHHMWRVDTYINRENITKTAHAERSRFEDSILKLRNMKKKIVIIGPTPCPHFHVRQCLAAAGPLHGLKHCPTTTRWAEPYLGTLREQKRQKHRVAARADLKKMMKGSLFAKGLKEGWLSYVDPFNTFCERRTGECLVSIDGVALYSDTVHMTSNATLHMKGTIRKALAAIA